MELAPSMIYHQVVQKRKFWHTAQLNIKCKYCYTLIFCVCSCRSACANVAAGGPPCRLGGQQVRPSGAASERRQPAAGGAAEGGDEGRSWLVRRRDRWRHLELCPRVSPPPPRLNPTPDWGAEALPGGPAPFRKPPHAGNGAAASARRPQRLPAEDAGRGAAVRGFSGRLSLPERRGRSPTGPQVGVLLLL